MTQNNIIVSPNVSACLKPGSLCRSFRISTFAASPGLRPAELGDTTLVGPVCPSGPPGYFVPPLSSSGFFASFPPPLFLHLRIPFRDLSSRQKTSLAGERIRGGAG